MMVVTSGACRAAAAKAETADSVLMVSYAVSFSSHNAHVMDTNARRTLEDLDDCWLTAAATDLPGIVAEALS